MGKTTIAIGLLLSMTLTSAAFPDDLYSAVSQRDACGTPPQPQPFTMTQLRVPPKRAPAFSRSKVHQTAQNGTRSHAAEGKTPEYAMQRIVNVLNAEQLKELERRVSFDVADWPATSGRFVKVVRDDMPILGEHSFTTPILDIRGLTKGGEVLELIEEVEVIELPNPLGWQGVGNGVWYHVRSLNNKDGWIYAGQRGCTSPFATCFQRSVQSEVNMTKMTELGTTLPDRTKLVIAIVFALILAGVMVSIMSGHLSRAMSRSHPDGASGYSSGSSSRNSGASSGSSGDSSHTAP